MPMPTPRPPPARLAARLWQTRYLGVYLVLVALLVSQVAHFRQPETGFSSLIRFGEQFRPYRLEKMKGVEVYTVARTAGYDGQFYAQIAVAGNPLAPELVTALDSSAYRRKRVLLPLAAAAVGLGNTRATLEAYALANVACWLVLAFLLARWWFPPTDLDNLLRWAGTLFCAGALVSLRSSLTDLPALLLTAVAIRQVQRGRPLAAGLWMAASGLVRETNALAAVALTPGPEGASRRERWGRVALAAAIAVVPVAAWSIFLRIHDGNMGGGQALDWPLIAFLRKLAEVPGLWAQRVSPGQRLELAAVLSLAVQMGFILARPQPRREWWRLGVVFVALGLCASWVVWKTTAEAAARSLLPLTLAFNVLVPRSRAGLALLIAGNLTVASAPLLLTPPRPDRLVIAPGVSCVYEQGWYAPEAASGRVWRWSEGPTALRLHNGTPRTRSVTLTFTLGSVTPRTVTIESQSIAPFVGKVGPGPLPVMLGPLEVPPGDTFVRFTTTTPPFQAPDDPRALAFSLENLRCGLVRR